MKTKWILEITHGEKSQVRWQVFSKIGLFYRKHIPGASVFDVGNLGKMLTQLADENMPKAPVLPITEPIKRDGFRKGK